MTAGEPVTAGEPATVGEPVTSGEPVTTGEPVTAGEPATAGESRLRCFVSTADRTVSGGTFLRFPPVTKGHHLYPRLKRPSLWALQTTHHSL